MKQKLQIISSASAASFMAFMALAQETPNFVRREKLGSEDGEIAASSPSRRGGKFAAEKH